MVTSSTIKVDKKGYFDVMCSSVTEKNGEIVEPFPGVDVEFVIDANEDKTNPRIVFEYNPEAKNVRLLVWADPNSEDYSNEFTFEV